MNNYNSITNSSKNAGSRAGAAAFEYDLKLEKEKIEAIKNKVKKDLAISWRRSYANAPVFPPAVSAIHPEVVDFLLSFSLVQIYDDIARQANLNENGRSILPQIVWQIAQTKDWNSLDSVLESKIQLVHSMHVLVTQLLQQNILSKIKILSEKPVVNHNYGSIPVEPKTVFIEITLSQALSEYPKLGEQNITGNQIRIKSFPVPARPSIKNWIADYHDQMGAGKHSPIDRGKYLFHSENGKSLSSIERQRLGIVLKSLDEQIVVTIDPEKQAVVFTSDNQGANVNANQNSGQVPDSRLRGNDNFANVLGKPNDIFEKRTDFANVNKTQQSTIDLRTAPSMVKREIINETQIANNNVQQKIKESRDDSYDGIKAVSQKPEMAGTSKVELKNISFSPNFVAAPRTSDSRFETVLKKDTPLGQHVPLPPLNKEEMTREKIFSVPGSKPPLGSENYDVSKSVINNQSSASFEEARRDSYAKRTNSVDIDAGPIFSQGNIGSPLNSNFDSMSDEMLMKLYNEKKAQNKNVASTSKIIGFHIGATNSEPDAKQMNNIVDLRN